MGAVALRITSLTFVYSTLYSDADQRKHQSPASLAFVRGIHRDPVNSSHKWPVTRRIIPFDDVIMEYRVNGSVYGCHADNTSSEIKDFIKSCPEQYYQHHELTPVHDDVIKWKYFPRYCPFVRGIYQSIVNSPHKDHWHGALMFSLTRARINGWVNNREAGDFRHHRTQCDATVMTLHFTAII